MADTVRMPITTAYRKGISSVVAAAEKKRVVLTSHGRPVAVVDSAERTDEELRATREAARLVVENFADVTLSRTEPKFSLEQVCARLGIDASEVRRKAADRRAGR